MVVVRRPSVVRRSWMNLHHNFVRFPTVEKFNPQLIFHSSNTEEMLLWKSMYRKYTALTKAYTSMYIMQTVANVL